MGVERRLARPDVLEAFERNLVALVRLTAPPDGRGLNVMPDVVTAVTGIPAPPFNLVTAARFDGNVDQRIDQVVAAMDDTRLPWSWWIGPTSRPDDLASRLRDRGLDGEGSPAMALELDGWELPTPASGIEVERVRDAAGFHETSTIAGAGFEMSAEIMEAFERTFGDHGYAEDSPLRTYVARINGRAVATAGVLVDGPVAGVYNVATLPDARGRGAGTAVTAAVVADGQRSGASVATLEASEMGVRVYERIGFVTVATIAILVRRNASPRT